MLCVCLLLSTWLMIYTCDFLRTYVLACMRKARAVHAASLSSDMAISEPKSIRGASGPVRRCCGEPFIFIHGHILQMSANK